MKFNIYSILIITLLLFSTCSKEEEFAVITPSQINFVQEGGALLVEGDCIDPNKKYYVSITTFADGDGSFKPTKVEYTVNGISYSMTFISDGIQRNPISLEVGLNIAQIVESGYRTSIKYAIQGDFELVQ